MLTGVILSCLVYALTADTNSSAFTYPPITTTYPPYPDHNIAHYPPGYPLVPATTPPLLPSSAPDRPLLPPGFPFPTSKGPSKPPQTSTAMYSQQTSTILPEGCFTTDQRKLLSCHGSVQFPVLDETSARLIEEIEVKDCRKHLLTLNNDHLSIYTNLNSLTVTNCGLSQIAETTFKDNLRLKHLDVTNNNLTVIGYTTILNIRNPTSINLMNNPFVCNCSMIWISVLIDHNISIVSGDPYCDTNVPLKTLSLPNCEEPQTDIYAHSATTGLSIGDNVTLSCNASGLPAPQVVWDKPKCNYTLTEVNPSEVVIHMINLTREDNGEIACFGKNIVWRSRKKMLLQINVGVKIEELEYYHAGNCLMYIISGTPPYNITWEHDGQMVPSDGIFWEDNVCADPSCSTYEYDKHKGCKRWNAGKTGGIYRISVSNAFGSDNKSTKVGLQNSNLSSYPVLDIYPSVNYDLKPGKVDVTEPDWSEKTYAHVVAPVIAAVVGVLALLLMGVYCKHKHKTFKKTKHVTLGLDGDGQEMARLTQIPDMLDNPHYHLLSKQSSQKLRVINVKELIFIKELGEGAFGRVYLGSCINLFTGDDRTMVAIKTLKTSVTEEALRDFEHEAELMAEVSHENIVSFYGISYNGESLMMIFEYMENKDLNNYLRSNGPDASSLGYPTWNSNTLFIYDLLYIAKQISAGMSYLATRHFVHRDLATRNCLVGEKLIVKIGDFGMSRDIYSTDYYKVGGQTMLPIRWMPPESVLYRKFTIESDVWSFGVVLWEIFSYGRQPWFELSNMEVIEYIKDGKLLKKPEDCTDELYELMLGCWHTQPSQRMTMSEIHDLLCNYLAPDSPYNNNSRTLENRECQQFTMLDV